MRGKHRLILPTKIAPRLIPACAGKTRSRCGPAQPSRAHPRVCGENQCGDVETYPVRGSSPRVRGKLRGRMRRCQGSWLIPACAGKTLAQWAKRSSAPAHPRVCGENTERSGVLTLRSVRSWKTLSFPSSLKVTHCMAFMQLSLSRIRL